MKKTTYQCNLCGPSQDKTIDELVGIYWVSNREFKYSRPSETEIHVCKQCLRNVLDQENLHHLAAPELPKPPQP